MQHSAFRRQCHVCHRRGAMRVVDHPAGRVLLCQFCSAVRRVSRAHRLAAGS